MNKAGATGSYSVFLRLNYIIENQGFFLNDYIRKFEIGKRTAYRDIDFIRNYKDYNLVNYNGRYVLTRDGVYNG